MYKEFINFLREKYDLPDTVHLKVDYENVFASNDHEVRYEFRIYDEVEDQTVIFFFNDNITEDDKTKIKKYFERNY